MFRNNNIGKSNEVYLKFNKSMLTQLSLMEISYFSLLDRTISVLRVVDGIFHFYLNLNRTFCLASNLGLLCLPVTQQKDARLI